MDEGAAGIADVGRLVEIPVCYDAEFGPDLQDVATHTNLPVEDVVRLHSGATYDVCFLGFTAGFAYLGGMPEALQLRRVSPRRVEPSRQAVWESPAAQTGIYPY